MIPTEQAALPVGCDTCGRAVVGSSITGTGHVCRRCNEREWGEALSRNPEPYHRAIGERLLVDASTHRTDAGTPKERR